MTTPELRRVYILSDTIGGPVEKKKSQPDAAKTHYLDADPLKTDDPDAIISHHVRGSYQRTLDREFDTLGRAAIIPHVLRTVCKLHDEAEERKKKVGITGLVINSAPRTEANVNGNPFYLAELKGGVRIVTTPLEVLASVRHRVERVYLVGEEQGVWPKGTQFRSSYVGELLDPNHPYDLPEEDPEIIPGEEPVWQVCYVDRFGNIITRDARNAESRRNEPVEGDGILVIGGEHKRVRIVPSLLQAGADQLAIYGNDGNRDIAHKWRKEWDEAERLENSAYLDFSRPRIGAEVSLTAVS